MSLSEMTKNDLSYVDDLLEGGKDMFCAECDIRLSSGKQTSKEIIWKTCTKWEEAHTCYTCYYKGEQDNLNKCWCGSQVVKGTKMCPKHHEMAQPTILPGFEHTQSPELAEKLRKYQNRFLWMDFVYDKPGVWVRYVGPPVDHDKCAYCGKIRDKKDYAGITYVGGTRFQFCNPWRDKKDCYSRWVEENDMSCKIMYEGMKCHNLKLHSEQRGSWHEFRSEDRIVYTDENLKVTYDWQKGKGVVVE